MRRSRNGRRLRLLVGVHAAGAARAELGGLERPRGGASRQAVRDRSADLSPKVASMLDASGRLAHGCMGEHRATLGGRARRAAWRSSPRSSCPPPAGADERPNFVHILTDDQTVDSLASMPFTQIVLGVEGATFTNHHAVQPLCCPSRASFLTGQYPHNHGVLNNLPPFGYDRLNFKRTIYTALRPRRVPDRLDRQGPQRPRLAGDRPGARLRRVVGPARRQRARHARLPAVATTGPPSTSTDTFQNDYLWGRARDVPRAASRRPRSCSPCR